MLTLEKVFRKWADARGAQNITVRHVPDADKNHIYFYLVERDGPTYPFKLGTTNGQLNGIFVSDFEGNCDTQAFCYWARKMKSYTLDFYGKGLIDILKQGIQLFKEIHYSKHPIDISEAPQTITRYKVGYHELLKRAKLAAVSLGLKLQELSHNRWRLIVEARQGSIDVLITFGINENTCPVVSVIKPRINLRGNVAFGGLVQYKGLTPITWDRNIQQVPKRVKDALENEEFDLYSDESYKLDEIRACRAKFFTNKLLYGMIAELRYSPLEVSESFYKENVLTSRSILFLDTQVGKTGPYTPVVSKALQMTMVSPLPGELLDLPYMKRQGTLKSFQYVTTRTFEVSSILPTNNIGLESNDFYNLKALGASSLALLNFDTIPFGQTRGLKEGEIAFNENMRSKYKFQTGEVISIQFVTVLDKPVNISANKDRKYVNYLYYKFPLKAEVDVVNETNVYYHLTSRTDSSLPDNVVGVEQKVLDDIFTKEGQKVDIKDAKRNILGDFRVVQTKSNYETADIIEVPNVVYERLLRIDSQKFITLAIATSLGLHGSYVTRLNDKLRDDEIALQSMQLINLNVVPREMVTLEITDLQRPSVVVVRPRRFIPEEENEGKDPITAAQDAFDEYTTLSTGHTIPLVIGSHTLDVDIIAIHDKNNNEMYSAYMLKEMSDLGIKEVRLNILPPLSRLENALAIPFEEEDDTLESSEEEVDPDFEFRSRSPTIGHRVGKLAMAMDRAQDSSNEEEEEMQTDSQDEDEVFLENVADDSDEY